MWSLPYYGFSKSRVSTDVRERKKHPRGLNRSWDLRSIAIVLWNRRPGIIGQTVSDGNRLDGLFLFFWYSQITVSSDHCYFTSREILQNSKEANCL